MNNFFENLFKSLWNLWCKMPVISKKKVKEEPKPVVEQKPNIIYSGCDISGWNETIGLQEVVLYEDKIEFVYYNMPESWNGIGGLHGNAWILIPDSNHFYAFTWEYLRLNQKVKSKASVNGEHIKQPSIIPYDWKPTVGVKYGFLISGLARGSYRNVPEKSNIIWKEWK